MKYSIVTFGCRVNQADSFVIEQGLRSRGATEVQPHEADVLVVNTCSVTASADQGARQTIRRVVRANPGVRVVVTGCYATRRPDEIAALPNVARVVPNSHKDDVVEAIAAACGRTTADRFSHGEGACGDTLGPGLMGRTALTLRVQTGCEEHCSYCIIPRTRGQSLSRPIPKVLEDVFRALTAGYKEIIITGVHLGSYGRDLDDGSSLEALVRTLSSIDDDAIFRISSLEPMDCTPGILEIVKKSARMAPHLHLPLQHGCDRVLRAMRRPYTSSSYRDLVNRIRRDIPDASIGSDIIVGFPGETDADFLEMSTLLEKLPLTYLHVFPYSDRPGTEAAGLQPKVDGMAIRLRAREVRAIGERKAHAFRQGQVGKTRRALTVDDGSTVVTENYLKVRLSDRRERNEWVQVRIDRADQVMTGTALPH